MFDYFALNYVNFMKIDIEGAEYDFLLDKDLSMIHSLAIEIHGTFGQEKKNQLTGEEDIFCKPDITSVMFPKPCNYDKLQENGFVKKDTFVDSNDILIGKII